MAHKTLWLVRHGKSSWRHQGLGDELRPLNDRGYRQGPALSVKLAQCLPSTGVSWACSPAVRAYSTCQMLTDETPELIEELYPGEPRAVLRWLASQPACITDQVLVGHNPGMESLANWLTGQAGPMKTAQAVAIELDIENWHQTVPENVVDFRWFSSGE